MARKRGVSFAVWADEFALFANEMLRHARGAVTCVCLTLALGIANAQGHGLGLQIVQRLCNNLVRIWKIIVSFTP